MSTKESVLKVLEEKKGSSVSGEELAGNLGVSRAAIWKSIEELRKDGYSIDAITNKGYSLSPNSDVVSTQGISLYLDDPDLSQRIFVYKTLESTNETAKKMAMERAEQGTVIIAEHQTKGKGRMGRTFYSPSGSGIYMSMILRPSINISKAVLVTTAASVAVCKAIEKVTGISSSIKWVNDIYINNRKICGILTEAVTNFESGQIEYIIIGIGINFNSSNVNLPDEIAGVVGYLFDGTTDSVTRNQLIAEVINNMIQINKNLESREYLDDYRSRSLVLGKEIRVIQSGSVPAGQNVETAPLATAIDIDQDGGLVIKYKDGTIATLNSGEISIRLKQSE